MPVGGLPVIQEKVHTDECQWQSTASGTTAIVADTKTSIRAVFAQNLSSKAARSFTTTSLLDLKPGTVFRLTCPEIRISDCFDPARVQIRVKNFSLSHNDSIHQSRDSLVDIKTLPAITDRLGRFLRDRLGVTMARLTSNSAVDSSPRLKSQVSAKDDSDIENMGDLIVSQTEFATQLPYSPPKLLETISPRRAQMLGKRKVMGDLRQLVEDNKRAPKKSRPCTDNEMATSVEFNKQAVVKQADVNEVPVRAALERESPPSGQGAGSSMSCPGRLSEQKAPVQDLDSEEDGIIKRQVLPVNPAGNAISEGRAPRADDRLGTLARWRDRWSKTEYLPRYIQTISKAQNLLLATDDKWQPALVGQPSRPGTIPLDLLNSLTTAADQKAALPSQLVQLRQSSSSPHALSQGEACAVHEGADLPVKPQVQKEADQRHYQSQGGSQETESRSEESSVEWSPTIPPSSLPRRELPPDSSPIPVPHILSVPSLPGEGDSDLNAEIDDIVLSKPVQQPSIRDEKDSNQASRRHSNNTEDVPSARTINTETSSSSQEKPASMSRHAGARKAVSTAKDSSILASKTDFPNVEKTTNHPSCSPTINPSNDSIRRLECNDNVIQVPHTPFTAGPTPSSTSQPQWRQTTKRSPKESQTQPVSQQFPLCSSPQPVPRTFLRRLVKSQLIGDLHDLHGSKQSMEHIEIDSSVDGSVHDAYLGKPFSENQDRGDQPAEPQKVMLGTQNAFQFTAIAQRSAQGPEIRTTAESAHAYSDMGAVLEDRLLVASDSGYPVKRQPDALDDMEPSRESKRAKPTTASSVVSVSSEKPDFRQIDDKLRQRRREFFRTLRTDDNVPPLLRSSVLASNVSPRSESVQSSNRRHSAQTSILRQIPSSTPLTSMSAQIQKVLCERPGSTSDMSKKSFLRPEDQFLVFKQHYPTYEANVTQFLSSCRMIKKLRAARKLLPQGVWDDFVYRHYHDYRSHLREISQSDELESPLSYEEYYTDYVSEPVHLKGVIRLAFIDALSTEKPVPTFYSPQFQPPSQSDRPEDKGCSIAASSSASNVRPKESLADKPDEEVVNKVSMTLEPHLQLKEQEEARQSQSSSVHLWLQKSSGAASPDLGTPDRLPSQGDIPYIDLTENEKSSAFNLARELLPLRSVSVNKRRSGPVPNSRSPDAKTEPFKYFALGHAKLDVGKCGGSRIRTDAHGALRPEVQRIVDIFKWRGREDCL